MVRTPLIGTRFEVPRFFSTFIGNEATFSLAMRRHSKINSRYTII